MPDFLTNSENLFLIFSAVSFVLFTLVIVLFGKILSLKKVFESSSAGQENFELKNLRKISIQNEKQISEIQTSLDFILKSLKEKVGTPVIKRYNPFGDTGGNQSFSLALINGNGDGVILTNLFSREISKVFGKEILKNVSVNPLSPEEEQVLTDFREMKFKK
ncbi:MAG: hypothetical protein Fur0024_0920 [Patescibacteria group bacterium]